MYKVTIDGIQVEVAEGETILSAAHKAGVHIPTLCWMQKVNEIGSCRVCVVEVEGEEGLVAACNTPVFDGMVVRTYTPRVIDSRRTTVSTIMDSHRQHCSTCKRNGTCALQWVAQSLNIEDELATSIPEPEPWDEGFPLQRDNTKCIRCMRCVAECQKVQHCDVWEASGPGAKRGICVKGGKPITEAGCALCGQCITHCPTGALTARDDTAKVLAALSDPNVVTVAQVAPAIRTAWGEGVGLSREKATPGRLAAALRALGFDRVFDTDFAADLTIMEEAHEFLEWLGEGKPLPMFTSCCPGWVRFAKLHYPQFVGQLSTSKSPHQMLGAVSRALLGKQAEEEGKRLFVVSVMPCVAKKYEAGVPQLSTEAGQDIDAVLTTREFDRMLHMFGVSCGKLEEEGFDDPLGTSTGAGTIFGRTGGVMEAALRSAAFFITGSNPDFSTCDTTAATPERPWVGKELDIAGTKVRIAIASGLENTAQLLDALESGEAEYEFVEIMACPGGCVAGGGQPIAFNCELGNARAAVLNKLDQSDTLRYSHENPAIQELYSTLLEKPLSEKAEELLHTDQEAWEI